ncbi:hypothetical protein LY01_01328 [Nonlabens xylanidelens]|uniref:Uncharacterized protein n=1 Tax=Nonlabens xylanidelens TaxID=191564 RepID=A0A2S6INJ9_9FLAO|nr:hypothetical protein [Nonlabens xylanidelens]PPK95735.1 hypothetical protein LY01_01328 [Nonlabens xylanidelens]PQJ22528.1 hypothetical protein BST94_02860 [Nonlabens xylanidelens]
MTRTSSKIISIIFGVIAIYCTITLIPDKANRKLTAFNEKFSFEKEINISEKFSTDFESSYKIGISLDNPNSYKEVHSMIPMETNLEILHKGKPIEVYENNSFLSKSDTEYELKLKFVNANAKPNKLKIVIQVDVPGPSYDLLIEREYKWVFWIINGIILLIALITGYFGFRKKPAGNTV